MNLKDWRVPNILSAWPLDDRPAGPAQKQINLGQCLDLFTEFSYLQIPSQQRARAESL